MSMPQRCLVRFSTRTSGFAASADALRSMNERTTVAGVRKDGTEFPAGAIALLVQPDRHVKISKLFERLPRRQHVVKYETVGWTEAGAGVDVSLSVSPIGDSGGAITGIWVIGRELTRRKRLEALVKQTNVNLESRNGT